MFAVRTADKHFTEAHYEDLNTLYAHWWREITSKTHYYIHISV